MNAPSETNSSWQQTLHRRTVVLGYWTFGWLATLALSVFGPEFLWQQSTAPTVAAVLLNIIVGGGMILAHKRHLQSVDELERRIHLEAMALSLGVTLVLGLAWSALDIANVITFDAEIAHAVFVMGITHMIAVAIGKRKYR